MASLYFPGGPGDGGASSWSRRTSWSADRRAAAIDVHRRRPQLRWRDFCVEGNMRFGLPYYRGFVAGLVVGLALTAVTLLTVAAGGRVRARRRLEARASTKVGHVPRLRSEAPDVPPSSQRW
jgi:hypothetical protein